MTDAGLKKLSVAIIATTLAGCASITPTPECIVGGAAAGAIATSGGDSEDIAKGAIGGAIVGTLVCMAMDTGSNDDDQDGVINRSDQCPATPMGASVDQQGCNIDLDNDGIRNAIDECANTPAGEAVGDTGCPLPKLAPKPVTLIRPEPTPAATPESFDVPKVIIIDDLQFEFGSARLTESDAAKLMQQTSALTDTPALKLEVIGHTDDIGDPAYNQKLSLERAKAVVQALRGQGLIQADIIPTGKGETQPLLIGDTDFARSKNRRVELKIRSVQ